MTGLTSRDVCAGPGGRGAVMTATLDDVTKKDKAEPTVEERVAEELVRRACPGGTMSG
jgi:hypothetical protein